MLSDTIRGLCARIDGGDDEVLPILADALADAGDVREAGLRESLRRGHNPRPIAIANLILGVVETWHEWDATLVARALLDRLEGGNTCWLADNYDGRSEAYPTRSAAYLALAFALATESSSARTY